MGCFRYLKTTCIDIWENICNHRWKSLIVVLFAIAGIVVGVVLFNVSKYGWWYGNRIAYAERLFNGGFSLFFFFLLWSVVLYFILIFSNIHPSTNWLNCVILFVCCFYAGANTTATITCFSVWGVLFCIFVTLPEIIGYYIVCFVAFCEPSSCRTFRETMCDYRQCAIILAFAFVVKIIGFFVILRIITAVI